MRTKYQATGTDMIPNKNFWFNIPFLIKVKLLLPLMAVFFIVKLLFLCPSSEVIA